MTKGVFNPSQGRFSVLFYLVPLLALIFPLDGRGAPGQNSISAPASPGLRFHHKLQVNDPALGARIIAEGGRLIADYGGYQLYEADAISPALANHSRLE